MKEFLTHTDDWLTRAPHISGGQWLFLLLLLAVATLVLNMVTNTSDMARMVGNFLTLLAGAFLGMMLFPNLSPPLDMMANVTLAVFSGMTVTSLISMAILRPY